MPNNNRWKNHIDIVLTPQEIRFIEWMAKRDDVSPMHEMRILFDAELAHCMDLYLQEMLQEESNN